MNMIPSNEESKDTTETECSPDVAELIMEGLKDVEANRMIDGDKALESIKKKYKI